MATEKNQPEKGTPTGEQQKAQAAADKADTQAKRDDTAGAEQTRREAPGKPGVYSASETATIGAQAQGRDTTADEDNRGRDRLASAVRELGVDPRLDNRTGDQRPMRPTEDPVKPQHVDGPEVGHEAEFARKFVAPLKREEQVGEPLGAKAEGPHGLGPHGSTTGDNHGQPWPADYEGPAGDEDDPRNPAG